MKTALIGFTKLKYMPYMNGYLKAAEQAHFDLIYWDRDGMPDVEIPSSIVHAFCFRDMLNDEQPMQDKLGHFRRYRRFVLEILKSGHYDRLIILHSTPGLTILDYLLLHYRNAYILDYRDISHENHSFYKRLIARLVCGSYATFVSSDSFRTYLPIVPSIHTAHNLLPDALEHREVRRKQERWVPVIRIRFWGLIRHMEANTNLIRLLGNDERFEIHYHGRDQGTGTALQQLCKDEGVKNVFFHGEYSPKERYLFASETDIIDNIYDNDIVIKNAVGNKYYDAIALYLPQLCLEGSYMAKLVNDKHLGVCIRFEDAQAADRIYSYYHELDWHQFEQSCDRELLQIAGQNQENAAVIHEFLARNA